MALPLALQERPASLALHRTSCRRAIAKPPHASAGQGGESCARRGGWRERYQQLPSSTSGAASSAPPSCRADNLLVRMTVGALTEGLRLAGVGCAPAAELPLAAGRRDLTSSVSCSLANCEGSPTLLRASNV